MGAKSDSAPVDAERVNIKPIRKRLIRLGVRGKGVMAQHKWAEKAKREMREKHAGKKTKTREVRDPHQEFIDATYFTAKGEYGIPAMALKAAIIGAAHKDLGIEKTLVKKALFLRCTDPEGVLAMKCSDPVMREDMVRVGQGGTDLRYRPFFAEWSVQVIFEVDGELLTTADLCTLIDRAGFGVGIGEMRPEKGGEYGRFQVDNSVPVEELKWVD